METRDFGRIWLCIIIMTVLMLVPPTAVGAEQLAQEQIARLAVGVNDIGTVDPHFAVKIGESPIVRMVYESLLRHPPGEINIEKIEPALAVRWEVAADKLTWTFHLRKGVQPKTLSFPWTDCSIPMWAHHFAKTWLPSKV